MSKVKKELSEILTNPNKQLEFLNGFVKKLPENPVAMFKGGASNFLEYIMAANKAGLGLRVLHDTNKLITAGELPNNFIEDDLSRKTYVDIAEIIDSQNPDQLKIDSMFALLCKVADTKESRRYEISIHLNTLKQIDSVELNVLMTCYRVSKEMTEYAAHEGSKSGWRNRIIEKLKWGKNMVYEIEQRESHMEQLRLLDTSPGVDKDNLSPSGNFRLTGLAIELAEILTKKVN